MIRAVLEKKSLAYKRAKASAGRQGWDWRWIRSEQDVKAVLDDGCYFEARAGQRVVKFYERFLRLWKGIHAGEPFRLQPWQSQDLILPMFGWRRRSGTRRFRLCYIEIPKKNGKSTLSSGLALYLTAGDNEPGAENYCAANDEEQARIVYDSALRMVKASPELKRRMKIRQSPIYMEWIPTASVLKPLSRDVESKEGLDIHGLIYDEFHAVKSRRMWDTLKFGGAAREQPLFVIITTAGEDESGHSVWAEERRYARSILGGQILNSQYFSLIYAAEESDDWTKPRVWQKANPSLGLTLKMDDMQAACDEAKGKPSLVPVFKRYRLNIPCHVEERWIAPGRWAECRGDFDVGDLLGRECYAAVDMSATKDITALALVFPPDVDEEELYRLFIYLWCPGEIIRRRAENDRVPYDVWQRQGWIEPTAGDAVDRKAILHRILQCAQDYKLRELGYDPWRALDLIQDLQDEGWSSEREPRLVELRQGYRSFAFPTAKFEELVLSRKLIHQGNPVMEWMVNNVVLRYDPAGNMKPDKDRSPEKIDGVVAGIMALGRAVVHERAKPSIYSDRTRRKGLLVL